MAIGVRTDRHRSDTVNNLNHSLVAEETFVAGGLLQCHNPRARNGAKTIRSSPPAPPKPPKVTTPPGYALNFKAIFGL